MRKIKLKKYQQGSTVSVYNPTMNLLPQYTPIDDKIPLQIASMLKPIDVTPYFQAQNLFLERDKFEEQKRQFDEEKELKKQDNSLRRIALTKTFMDDMSAMSVLAPHQEMFNKLKEQHNLNQETLSKAYGDQDSMTDFIGSYSTFASDPQVRKLLETKTYVEELLKQGDDPRHAAMMSVEDQQRRLNDIQALVDNPYGDHKIAALDVTNYYNKEYKDLEHRSNQLDQESKLLQQEHTRLVNEGLTENNKALLSEVEVKIGQNQLALDKLNTYKSYIAENSTEGMSAAEIAEVTSDGRIIAGIDELPTGLKGLMTPSEYIAMSPAERAATLSAAISKSSTVSYSTIRQDPRNEGRAYKGSNGQAIAVNPYMNSEELSKMDKGSMIAIVRPDGSEVTVDYNTYNKLFGGKLITERRVVEDGITTKESVFGEMGHPNFGVPRSFAIEDIEDEQILITNDPLVAQQFGLVSAQDLQENPFNQDTSWVGDNSNPNWKFVPDETGQTGGHWEFKLGKPDANRMKEIASSAAAPSNKPQSPIRTEAKGRGGVSLTNNLTFKNNNEYPENMSNGAVTRTASIPFDNVVISGVVHHNNPDQVDISVTRGSGQEVVRFYNTEDGYVNAIVTGTKVLHEVDPGTHGLLEKEYASIHGKRVQRYGGCKSCTGGDKYTAEHLHMDKMPPTQEEIEYAKNHFVEKGDMFNYNPNERIETGDGPLDRYLNAVALTEEGKNASPEDGFYGGVGYFTIATNSDSTVDMGKFGINNKWHMEKLKKLYDIDYPEQFIMNPVIQRDYMGRLYEEEKKFSKTLQKKYGDYLTSENFPLLANQGILYLSHNAGQGGAERYINAKLAGDDDDFVIQIEKNLTRFHDNRATVASTQTRSKSKEDNTPKFNF